ncbi:cell wall metabolism sensor histidine kinase WalK [Synechococcus sp. PCC 7336]|uniref:sensor histidine kinase n=1 Tax=Synechococcus sp. PCC 7336 TaxID=195250 RepID=UPI00034CB327|nr:HAMP domain-containing sensor histidine kinase [Synechococcus sp. PCC 7336]
MAAIWILLGLGLGLGLHLQWRRRLLHNADRLFRKLGVVRAEASGSDLLAQNLSQVIEIRRKQLQQQTQLQQQLDDCKTLQNALPLGFIQVDRHNRMLACNLAARQLFDIPNWRPGNKVLLEWVRSYELDRLVQATRRRSPQWVGRDPLQAGRQSEGEPLEMREWSFYPPDGESKPLPLRGWGIPLSEGQVGVLLEDRREATQLAQQRDRWASDVAHELKTPLTSIRLLAETLQSRVDAPLRKWVDRLLNEILRLSDLVQDLLELSRLDLKLQAALQVNAVDLAEVCHSAWRSLEPLAAQKGVTLTYAGPGQVEFCGDRPRLHRLFLNLFDNALKYSPEGAAIQLNIGLEKDCIRCEICDRGPGFPPNTVDSVFGRFYRADPGRARSQGGTGLGLAIAKQIVEVHGGQISARNHPELGGACLTFTLSRRMSAPTGASGF